jgi:hypothetical protein
MWSSALPCEKLSRTTSTPALIMRASTSGELDAGPRVATIFVARTMRIPVRVVIGGLWGAAPPPIT